MKTNTKIFLAVSFGALFGYLVPNYFFSNKNSEIDLFLAFYKNQMLTKDTEYQVSFYDVYNDYCSMCRKNGEFIASKKYFEKYIIHNIPEDHISEDCFILSSWWK